MATRNRQFAALAFLALIVPALDFIYQVEANRENGISLPPHFIIWFLRENFLGDYLKSLIAMVLSYLLLIVVKRLVGFWIAVLALIVGGLFGAWQALSDSLTRLHVFPDQPFDYFLFIQVPLMALVALAPAALFWALFGLPLSGRPTPERPLQRLPSAGDQ